MGIEPTRAILKTAVLPLNYTPFKTFGYGTLTLFGYLFKNTTVW